MHFVCEVSSSLDYPNPNDPLPQWFAGDHRLCRTPSTTKVTSHCPSPWINCTSPPFPMDHKPLQRNISLRTLSLACLWHVQTIGSFSLSSIDDASHKSFCYFFYYIFLEFTIHLLTFSSTWVKIYPFMFYPKNKKNILIYDTLIFYLHILLFLISQYSTLLGHGRFVKHFKRKCVLQQSNSYPIFKILFNLSILTD